MALPRHQIKLINSKLASLNVELQPDYALIDASAESEDVKSRNIAELFNDPRIPKTRPVPVPMVEQKLRSLGYWSALLSSANPASVELMSLFTSSMAEQSINCRDVYMSTLIDNSPEIIDKESVKAVSDYLVSFAEENGLPKLYMRDIREARK